MKQQVTCKSGIQGWQCPLQEDYVEFAEFDNCDAIYGLASRLGFDSAREAWDANPVIQGSVIPEDYRVVIQDGEPDDDPTRKSRSAGPGVA